MPYSRLRNTQLPEVATGAECGRPTWGLEGGNSARLAQLGLDGTGSAIGNGASSAPGPFDGRVNAALGACFGPNVGGLTAAFGQDSFNKSIGALASTAGSEMSFGSSIRQDVSDSRAMEVIGHEVAHALAGGGSGQTSLDAPGDAGEASADRSGQQFARFVAQGGPAPTLTPASGGKAAIHRFESAEHRNAVEGAGDRMMLNAYLNGTLSDAQRREMDRRLSSEKVLSEELDVMKSAPAGSLPAAKDVDPDVVALMQADVKLDNGVSLTPGQITALMGDFYGVFDADGNLDPVATFDQMNNAKPEELYALTAALAHEESGGRVESEEWEAITRMRNENNPAGTPDQLTYLELAERNDAHFSGETMEGTDNNMGAYTALHAAALQAAEDGDMERARGLEASSMHYLTDRHAAGHAFSKEGVMEASGYTSSLIQNLFVKSVHDDYNKNGMTLTNGAGESWMAYGDDHWGDEGNAANRVRTAESVYTSYGELNAVGSGQSSASEVEESGYGAHQTVGQFSQVTQDDAEQRSRDLRLDQVARNVAKEVKLTDNVAYWELNDGVVEPGIAAADRSWDQAGQWVDGQWNAGMSGADQCFDNTRRWADNQYDGAVNYADQSWDAAAGWADATWDGGLQAVSNATHTHNPWVNDQVNGGLGYADQLWNCGGQHTDKAWNAGVGAADNAWDTTSNWAENQWDQGFDYADTTWNNTTGWADDRWDEGVCEVEDAWSAVGDWLND